MPVHTPTPGAVVVVTAEDDRFATARRSAVDLAVEQGRPLILYDWDAPSLFSEPLPTWWSSEGWDRRVTDRLDPEALDAVGRSRIADQAREAAERGVAAFGWLPSDHGSQALADYANNQGASIVVVPRGLTELDGLEALVNGSTHPVQELDERAAARVVVAG
jgi:hypothetical protein